MTLFKVSPLLLVILTSTNSWTQRSSDIGIALSSSSSNRILLEYRLPLADKYHLKFGASYGPNSNPFYSNGQIVESSDSSVTQRYYNHDKHIGKLRFGLSRQLGQSYFSLGTDLIVGYEYLHQRYTNRTVYLNESGEWEYQVANTNFLLNNDPTSSRVTKHFVTTGIQLGADLSVPIGDRFFINVRAAALMDVRFIVKESNKIDPYQEFPSTKTTLFDFDNFLSIGLRYRFGKDYTNSLSDKE